MNKLNVALVQLAAAVVFLLGALTITSLMPWAQPRYAPQLGSVADLEAQMRKVFMCLDGSNSSSATGVWNLTGTVLVKATDVEVVNVCKSHIFHGDPAVVPSELDDAQDGWLFFYDSTGGLVMGHAEDGKFQKWELWPEGEGPPSGLAVVINGQTRMVRRVVG